jgi:protein arginine N-methyltransferase 2
MAKCNFVTYQFDTFSEHYKDLRTFFDTLPDLLRGEGSRFSFFHGLGATSMSFYEVYTQVSECHLRDIGLKTEWHEVGMLDQGETTWDGVTRRVSLLYYALRSGRIC